jgi:hypothetical protein
MFGLFKKKPLSEPTPDYATLYISDPSLLGSTVLDSVPGVLSYEGMSDEAGDATGMRLRLKAGECIINFMPAHMVEEHLAGLSEMAEEMVRDRERLPYILHRIGQVRFVLGCVAPTGFGDTGEMIETLMQLNAALNGLFFMGDSLFDHNAEPLFGSACDK